MDRVLYRRVKAKAALMGYKVSAGIQEAIKKWLEESKSVETEYDVDNSAYEAMKAELQRNHGGMYAVFHSDNFLGAAHTLKDAGKLVRETGAKRVLMVKVDEEEPAGGE